MVRAIGLSGFSRAGKTTAAEYIERNYGFKRRHIAEPLRAMLAVLLRANGYREPDITDILEGSRKDGWIIPEFGVTSRHLQITIGTEWGRELVNPDLWANTWTKGVGENDRHMNDSVRFPNEEKAIRRDLGGITIMIQRPGAGPAAFKWGWIGKKLYQWLGLYWGVHDSERLDRLQPDHVVINNGSRFKLYEAIDEVMYENGILPVSRLVPPPKNSGIPRVVKNWIENTPFNAGIENKKLDLVGIDLAKPGSDRTVRVLGKVSL